MIGEQEIINRINALYKLKNYSLLETYIFIHLQYLIKVKQNYRLALYFNSKYSLLGKKINFLSRYFLYETKKYISKSIIQLKNIKLIKDPYIIKYQKENYSLKKLMDYLKLYTIIKRLLKISCEQIIYFYSFCSDLHNSLSLQKYTKSKIYPIIKAIKIIQDSIFKLKYLIEKYNKDEKHPIESIELSYLLTNFFKLMNGKLTQNFLKNIIPILYFKKIHYEKLENDFHCFMMSNPLVISLANNDSFNITYFTNIFLEKLGYSYSDLKFQDFHEKLFPGGPELIKEHSYIMKQFLFFNKNNFSKYKTFIKSKEGYLVSCNIVCKLFPNFSEDFSIIANITFIEDNSLSEIDQQSIDNNKKTNVFNLSNDKILNIYSFILNYDFDIFGMTKNFFLEYNLNQNMLRELRLNFCQFFCMDENKLIEQIHKEKNKLLKLYPNLNHKISLTEINKAYSPFLNISIENTFKIRKENLLENYFIPPIIIYDKIDKKKLFLKVPEIINIIDEIGLDYDWYIRLKNFRERLINNNINNNNFSPKRESKISNITPNLGDNYKYSSVLDTIKLDTNLMKMEDQFFEVVYSIRKIGSLTYYIAILYETIDYSKAKTPVPNDKQENSRIITIKENLLNNEKSKTGNLTSIKLTRFLSVVSLKKEDKDKENEDNNSIKRKAKTKVFPQDLNLKKSNLSSYSINNVKPKNTKKLNSKENENNLINEENKKEESNKEKEIIIELNDKTKTKNQDNLKTFNKMEYLQKMKTKKKELHEEEENSPLIEKNKFNEILQKNNKRNKILIIILFIITFLVLSLNIIKFTISMVGFEISKNVLKTTIYFEMLKIDIYVQGILSLIYCINEIEPMTYLSYIHSEARLKINSTMIHIKLLQDQLNIIINSKLCSGIFKILVEKMEIYNLNKFSSLYSSNSTCNITSTFYKYQDINSDIYFSGKVERANEIQKILYYFLRNIFSAYKIKFDLLSEECSSTIEKLWLNFQKNLYALLISIISINILFVAFYIIKICLDYSYYQILILFYYNIENSQMEFENQIFYLNKIINEFNSDNIEYFEYMKNNPN